MRKRRIITCFDDTFAVFRVEWGAKWITWNETYDCYRKICEDGLFFPVDVVLGTLSVDISSVIIIMARTFNCERVIGRKRIWSLNREILLVFFLTALYTLCEWVIRKQLKLCTNCAKKFFNLFYFYLSWEKENSPFCPTSAPLIQILSSRTSSIVESSVYTYRAITYGKVMRKICKFCTFFNWFFYWLKCKFRRKMNYTS